MDLQPIPSIPTLYDYLESYYPKVLQEYIQALQDNPHITVWDFLVARYERVLADYAIVAYREGP